MYIMTRYGRNMVGKAAIHHGIFILFLVLNNHRLVVVMAAIKLYRDRDRREELVQFQLEEDWDCAMSSEFDGGFLL